MTVDFNCVVCGLLKTSDHQETNFNVLQTRRPFLAGRTNFNSDRKISFQMCNSTFNHQSRTSKQKQPQKHKTETCNIIVRPKVDPTLNGRRPWSRQSQSSVRHHRPAAGYRWMSPLINKDKHTHKHTHKLTLRNMYQIISC